jgi:regulator of replication initiation timing
LRTAKICELKAQISEFKKSITTKIEGEAKVASENAELKKKESELNDYITNHRRKYREAEQKVTQAQTRKRMAQQNYFGIRELLDEFQEKYKTKANQNDLKANKISEM